MRPVKIFFLIFATTLLIAPPPTHAQATPPNVIFILADDLGIKDLSSFGATQISTPNIDSIGTKGLTFKNFYSTAATCTPTRISFLTGRYPTRVGIDRVIPLTGAFSQKGIPQSEILLPEILKTHGYGTALIGKWHLGHQPEFNPTQNGFDYFYGIPYSNDYNNGQVPLWENTQVLESITDQQLLTHRYTQKAVEYIASHKSSPFFLYFAHSAPHYPIYPHPDFVGSSSQGPYGDIVQEMDWSVGQIIQALKDNGIEDNTILVFTSDNGPWIYYQDLAGNPGIYRCGKATNFDGGLRVPALIQWPQKISPGTTTSHYAQTIDFFSTFLDLLQIPPPPATVIDSHSLTDTIFSNSPRLEDEIIFSFNLELQAIRSGKWKLKKEYAGGQFHMAQCGIEPHPKYLFNLESDPSETINLVSVYPEVVSYLENELAAYTTSLSQPTNFTPIAKYSIDQTPTSLSISSIESVDPDGQIASTAWFINNQIVSQTKQLELNQPFPEFIKLQVTDNQGLTDSTLVQISSTPPSPVATPPILPGDLNHDQATNHLDYQIFANYFPTHPTYQLDIDQNNQIDILDFNLLVSNISPLP